MPKYYVAGIPFDSENALMHYGVKGMKWDKHIFGPDANTKYINWMDVGKLASSKRPSQFTDTASDRSASQGGALHNSSQQKGPGLVRSALDKGAQLRYKANQAVNQAGKAIGSAATSAARAAGGALNASSNFLTGNQSRSNLSDAQRSYDYNKKQMVNNARLYNQGKANLANATNLTNEASQRYVNASTGDNPNPDALNNLTNDLNRATEIANTANEQMQTSTNRKNDILDKTLAARKNLNQAQNAYDNTLPGIASRAGQGAKGFIDNAGQWISGAANDVGKAASNVWNGITGAANAAGDWVGNAAGDVGNFFTGGDQAKQNLIDAQRRSVDAGNRGQGVDVDNARAAYNRTAPGFINSAGKWVSNAAGDAGRWIGGAASDAWNGVSGAAKSVGDWFGERASDVSDYLTGDRDRRTAQMLRNAADYQEDPNAPYRVTGREAEYLRNQADDYEQKANNSLFSRIGSAANDAGKWIGDRAGDVAGVATDAWNGVSGAAGDVGRWLGDRANDVGNLFSNRDELNRLQEASNAHDNAAATQAYQDYANHPITQVGNAARSAGDWIGNAAKSVGDFAQEAWQSPWVNPAKAVGVARDFFVGNPDEQNAARMMRNPERANQRGFFNQAGQWISDRAGDVAGAANTAWNGVRGAANQVGETIGNAASDVGNFVTGNRSRDEMARAMSDPDAYSSNQERYEAASRANDEYNRTLPGMAGQARNWATGVVNDVNNSISEPARQRIQDDYQREIDNVVNRINQRYGYEPGSTSFLGNEKAFTEYQQGISDAKAKYERELEDLKRNPIGGAIGNLFHSAIDDKPDGVTDTFWKNYVASGGTREQYERDWR